MKHFYTGEYIQLAGNHGNQAAILRSPHNCGCEKNFGRPHKQVNMVFMEDLQWFP